MSSVTSSGSGSCSTPTKFVRVEHVEDLEPELPLHCARRAGCSCRTPGPSGRSPAQADAARRVAERAELECRRACSVRVQELLLRSAAGVAVLAARHEVGPLVGGQARARDAVRRDRGMRREDGDRPAGRCLDDRADLPAAEHARMAADLSSSAGSASTRLALKMCGRCVSVSPSSSPGFSRSLTLDAPTPFSLPISGTLPVVRDSVYDAWNCEPWPKRLTSCVCSELYVVSRRGRGSRCSRRRTRRTAGAPPARRSRCPRG